MTYIQLVCFSLCVSRYVKYLNRVEILSSHLAITRAVS